MGHMIGMPCLKLNNVGSTSKKCGDFGAVAREALEERQGRDKDIDHDKSSENIYTGYRTAAELQEYSRKHIEELSAKQVAAGGRKVRSDAVVMIATVIKPPAVLMNSLSRSDQIRLLRDADDKLTEIIGADNCKSTVIHFDEQGAHLHKFWEPMTDDGRLCAKDKFNLKFFTKINKEIPAHLRSCGWDMIEDCKAYDEAAEKLKTEEQKAAERKSKGLTSVQYKAEAEAIKNKLCEEIDELKNQRDQLDKDIQTREDALNAVEEPCGRFDDADAIEDKAKTSRSLLRRSESVKISRKDFTRVMSVYRYSAALEVRCKQLESDNAYYKKENSRLNNRVSELVKDVRTLKNTVKSITYKLNIFNRLFSWLHVEHLDVFERLEELRKELEDKRFEELMKQSEGVQDRERSR